MRGVIDDTKLANIAATIREKTGTKKTYKPDDMASGVNEVYEAGQTDFINMLFNNGQRKAGQYLFADSDFSGYTFNPPLFPKRLGRMFYTYLGAELPKGIDCSKAEYTITTVDDSITPYAMFMGCYGIKEIYDMNIPPASRMMSFAQYCYELEKIELFRVVETTNLNSAFNQCYKLSYIRFEGVIGQNISFSSSPLTVESLKSIITHLKDYSGTTSEYTYTLTLKSDCWTALDAEGATAPGGVTWRDYVRNLGWNRA